MERTLMIVKPDAVAKNAIGHNIVYLRIRDLRIESDRWCGIARIENLYPIVSARVGIIGTAHESTERYQRQQQCYCALLELPSKTHPIHANAINTAIQRRAPRVSRRISVPIIPQFLDKFPKDLCTHNGQL